MSYLFPFLLLRLNLNYLATPPNVLPNPATADLIIFLYRRRKSHPTFLENYLKYSGKNRYPLEACAGYCLRSNTEFYECDRLP